MSDNFKNVLNEIKNLRKSLNFFSPSNNKEFQISPLSLKQQKSIIENGFSSSLSILFFNVTFFNIIKENFIGDIKDLNTLDRVNISLSLRQRFQMNIRMKMIMYTIFQMLSKKIKKK